MRDRSLSRRMASMQFDPVWRPQGKMTMSGDMPLAVLDMVNSILGGESRAEWEEELPELGSWQFRNLEESLRALEAIWLDF